MGPCRSSRLDLRRVEIRAAGGALERRPQKRAIGARIVRPCVSRLGRGLRGPMRPELGSAICYRRFAVSCIRETNLGLSRLELCPILSARDVYTRKSCFVGTVAIILTGVTPGDRCIFGAGRQRLRTTRRRRSSAAILSGSRAQ